jgi:hypothetical protein
MDCCVACVTQLNVILSYNIINIILVSFLNTLYYDRYLISINFII